jgi:Protein of unknown function (DUF1203)
MHYRISGLDPKPFEHLFGLDDASLHAQGVQRLIVDQAPGFPDRIELRDLNMGEHALLLNYMHQSADTPYRASHAIFIAEGARLAANFENEVPLVMQSRMLSVRAFDANHMMVDAELLDGLQLEYQINQFFAREPIAYLQVHYAKRGCFAGSVERA